MMNSSETEERVYNAFEQILKGKQKIKILTLFYIFKN